MMRGTGGGPNRLEPLSSLEERILALIGNVAVDGLPDVRVPLEGSSNTHDSPSILAGVQVLGGTPITAIDVPTQIQPNIDELIVEHVPVQREEIVELQTPLSPVFVLDNQAVLEDHVLSTPSTATAAVVETPTQAQDIPTATNRRTQPRRRRLQNRLSQNRQIFQDLNAPHWAYEMEQRRLANEERTAAALENLTVQLTEVVRSLNKIVAAIENK